MIEIPWDKFALVAGTVLVATVLLTAVYSGGVRLLETAEGSGAAGARRGGAYACFAFCAAVVLFGLWVIVPQFH